MTAWLRRRITQRRTALAVRALQEHAAQMREQFGFDDDLHR